MGRLNLPIYCSRSRVTARFPSQGIIRFHFPSHLETREGFSNLAAIFRIIFFTHFRCICPASIVMADSKKIDPVVSLYLDGQAGIQLNRKAFSGKMDLKIQTHERSKPVTLVLDGYREEEKGFDIAIALRRGLLDLIDIDTNNPISISPGHEEAGSLVLPLASPNMFYGLSIDSFDSFWKVLTPGRKYEIRWSIDSGQSWCYYGQPEESFENITRLPVQRLPRPIKLTVHDDSSAPPQFSISLTSTSSICYLSGRPRFAFELAVTSHDESPITVCLHKTPFREFHGLEEIVSVVDETGEDVEWPYGIGCFEGSEPFPHDDEFEELGPETPYRRTFSLDPYDPETSNGGELDSLEKHRTYKVELQQSLLASFGKWRKGPKAELLSGTEDEKKAKWSGSSDPILFNRTGSFVFETRP